MNDTTETKTPLVTEPKFLKEAEHFALLMSQRSVEELMDMFQCSRQLAIDNKLRYDSFFTEEELEVFKRGRNNIGHIPKNGDRATYECASGLEAVCGYLYLTDKERLDAFFEKVFEGGIDNE